MNKPLLSISNLKVDVNSIHGVYHTVRDINLRINEGEIHGIVGESGCGKTMTAKSIIRLHNESNTYCGGEITYYYHNNKYEILNMNKKKLSEIRGNEISMVFQDPITTLNPLIRIGEQISETIRYHEHLNNEDAKNKAIGLLESVGIQPGAVRYKQYPFEFSGGMLQRAIIAMAISCNPRLLIADEPTTALDVTMQAQILHLLLELRTNHNMGILIITHNFGVIAEICDSVSVMYAGQIVETGTTEEIFHSPCHPYTKALINSIPKSGMTDKKLISIPGFPPALNKEIVGCAFSSRCEFATEKCMKEAPVLTSSTSTHSYLCHNPL